MERSTWKVVIRKGYYPNFRHTGSAWFEDRADARMWIENNERFGMLSVGYLQYEDITSGYSVYITTPEHDRLFIASIVHIDIQELD